MRRNRIVVYDLDRLCDSASAAAAARHARDTATSGNSFIGYTSTERAHGDAIALLDAHRFPAGDLRLSSAAHGSPTGPALKAWLDAYDEVLLVGPPLPSTAAGSRLRTLPEPWDPGGTRRRCTA